MTDTVRTTGTPRLQHVYPQMLPPDDDPGAPVEDYRETWVGKMRIVHRQRARALRRRGVPRWAMWTLHKPGERAKYAWFVEVAS